MRKAEVDLNAINRTGQNLQKLKYLIDFDYRINVPNFPHNQIFGRILKLFKLKDMNKYRGAIEVIAGAKLRNVVVQNHNISRDLLQHQACRGFESYIPLNKIRSFVVPADHVTKLKQLSNGRVELAINLIEFDEKFQPAMALLFGNTFVADDEDTAKLVAFDNGFKKFNCVTLKGDSYRTDGILGGGANKRESLLDKVDQYLNFEKE
jgi:structural maintenance of chromosome 2